MLIRRNFFLTIEQDKFLHSLGNKSEHVRRAIDDYKAKYKPTSTISPSSYVNKS